MKIYTEDFCCDLCGEPGVATPRVAASQWSGSKLFHSDPRVCEENIRRKREADARKIMELESKLVANGFI